MRVSQNLKVWGSIPAAYSFFCKTDLCEAAAQWAEVLVACLVAEVDRSGLRVDEADATRAEAIAESAKP